MATVTSPSFLTSRQVFTNNNIIEFPKSCSNHLCRNSAEYIVDAASYTDNKKLTYYLCKYCYETKFMCSICKSNSYLDLDDYPANLSPDYVPSKSR